MTLALFLAVLLVGIALGIPVAFALLLASLALMLNMGIFSSDILAQSLVNGIDSFALLAIPFFLIAGETMAVGGLSKRIIRLAMAMAGHRRGGVGYVAIITAIVLAGLSGSAAADAAALVSILFPMMRQAGYPADRSAGLLASSGIIAPVIPPSVPLILVGVAGNLSITKLFLAGIAPGLIMGAALCVLWGFLSRNNDIAPLPKVSRAERIDALKDGIWALLLPLIIIVGIRFGIFTPTEAGVVAAVYALGVSTFVYRELTLRAFYRVLFRSAHATGMIMFLVGAALVAAYMITINQLPQQLATLLGPLTEDPKLLMLTIMVLVFLVGMVIDLSPSILILIPLFLPIVREAGIDPIYFGLMFVMNTSIGLITPPVGTVLNVVCGVGRIRLQDTVKGTLPFVSIYLVLLGLFIAVPELITIPMAFIVG
ncbi:TRAP transporter large permease subunit [Salinisphaera sp. USBA-960]|uniref:TRAP transporter large permease subunit n=1 Tax=Salinisphaera orenii TaxID=856731 RepID=UPI000DBE3A06|nr:TRAP transporter large permease subunit [Salifodinibacter halophilus]NNC25409.1 TRAP transporter large permease subunit [Salifodinibacter halophilus]